MLDEWFCLDCGFMKVKVKVKVFEIFKFVSVFFWVLILGDFILWVLLCGFMCG